LPTNNQIATDDSGKITETIMQQRDVKVDALLSNDSVPATTAGKAAGKATAKSRAKAKAKGKAQPKCKSKGAGRGRGKGNARMRIKTLFLPNQRQLRSLDNAWRQATSRGLIRFQIGKQQTSRPLKKGETRVFKRKADLPPGMCSGGRVQRSMITYTDEHGKTKERYEVGDRFEDPQRSSLHECIDMGTEGWQLRFYLYHHPEYQIRGTFMPDPPHREHNQFGRALTDAGQNYLKTDGAFLGNAFSGPWGAAANLDNCGGLPTVAGIDRHPR